MEISRRDFIQVNRKLILRQSRQAVGEMINRTVLHGPRAVPACVFHFEPEALIYLFTRLNGIQQVFSILDQALAALV